MGVDSLQALNLAFVGARNAVKNDLRVLSAFYKKLALTWENQPWDVSFPFWVCVFDGQQLSRLETFVEGLWRSRRAIRRASRKRARRRVHGTGEPVHAADRLRRRLMHNDVRCDHHV